MEIKNNNKKIYTCCSDCGGLIEIGLFNWIEHCKNHCTDERMKNFAETRLNLERYGNYLKNNPSAVKLSDKIN